MKTALAERIVPAKRGGLQCGGAVGELGQLGGTAGRKGGAASAAPAGLLPVPTATAIADYSLQTIFNVQPPYLCSLVLRQKSFAVDVLVALAGNALYAVVVYRLRVTLYAS